MRFSIIIPAYNTEKYIGECLDSVFKQSFNDYEVIVVNDGSSDGTLQICNEYRDKYAKKMHLINKRNGGYVQACRSGIEASSGDYLVFVDSDDWIVDNALEHISNSIDKYNADMVIYSMKCLQISGTEEIIRPQLSPGLLSKDVVYRELLFSNRINGMVQKAVKKEFFSLEDYDEVPVRACSDKYQTYPIIYRTENIVFLDEALYIYRKNDGGVTQNKRFEDYIGYLFLWEREKYIADSCKLSNEEYNILCSKRVSFMFSYIELAAKQAIVNNDYSIYEKFTKKLMSNNLFIEQLDNLKPKYLPRTRKLAILKLKKRNYRSCFRLIKLILRFF